MWEKDVHAHGLKQQSPLCQCADAQQQRAAMSGVGVGDWGGVSWSDSVTAASTAAVTHATPPTPHTTTNHLCMVHRGLIN